MDRLAKYLLQLDITEEESAIYINALEMNASTVLEFAYNTGIPRTTVYLHVETLLQKELLKEIIEGKRKKYIPASPQELITLVKKREELFKKTAIAMEQEIGMLNVLYKREQGKPYVQFKEGIKAATLVFKESLASDYIYMYFTSLKGREILGDIGEDFYDLYMSKMISTKQIIRESAKNIKYKAQESTLRNKIVLLDESFATETDFMIFNDSIVYITYKNNQPQILLVNDPQIAYFEKTKFNLLFSNLEKEIS